MSHFEVNGGADVESDVLLRLLWQRLVKQRSELYEEANKTLLLDCLRKIIHQVNEDFKQGVRPK